MGKGDTVINLFVGIVAAFVAGFVGYRLGREDGAVSAAVRAATVTGTGPRLALVVDATCRSCGHANPHDRPVSDPVTETHTPTSCRLCGCDHYVPVVRSDPDFAAFSEPLA